MKVIDMTEIQKNQPKWMWVLLGLTALAFVAAGGAKLMGVESVHKPFADMGMPSFTGYIVGLLEIAGAIGLFIAPLRFWAALGLAATALGGFAYHAAFTPISEGIPALVFLALSGAIAVLTKETNGAIFALLRGK